MDTTAATVFAVVRANVAVALAVIADKRALANERKNISPFPTETLERVLKTPNIKWFNKVTQVAAAFITVSPSTAVRGRLVAWPGE
ncbi:hypothetical protein F442_22292, partial [Phytophthora nicotianae P10297]